MADQKRNTTTNTISTKVENPVSDITHHHCIDCNKKINTNETGLKCSETNYHTRNHDPGYLCRNHYIRAQSNKGMCDECCWWDIT